MSPEKQRELRQLPIVKEQFARAKLNANLADNAVYLRNIDDTIYYKVCSDHIIYKFATQKIYPAYIDEDGDNVHENIVNADYEAVQTYEKITGVLLIYEKDLLLPYQVVLDFKGSESLTTYFMLRKNAKKFQDLVIEMADLPKIEIKHKRKYE